VFSYAYAVDASSFLNAENVQLITEKKRKNGNKKRAKRLKEKSKDCSSVAERPYSPVDCDSLSDEQVWDDVNPTQKSIHLLI